MMKAHLAAALVSVGIVAPLSGIVFERQIPLVFHEITTNSPVAPGDDLIVTYDLTRVQSCKTTIQKYILDSASVQHIYAPYTREAFGPPIRETKSSVTRVPTSATPGDAVYRVVFTFACTPLQRFFPLTLIAPDVQIAIKEGRHL